MQNKKKKYSMQTQKLFIYITYPISEAILTVDCHHSSSKPNVGFHQLKTYNIT